MTPSILGPRSSHSALRLAGHSILALLLLAILLGTVFTADARAAVGYSDQEIGFVNLLNDYRAANGLPRLLVSDMVSEAGDRHNSDMGKYAFFGHYSVKSDWFKVDATPWDRMSLSGYSYYTSKGENIAAGQSTAAQVFAAWKASPGHNANMLNSAFKVLGVSLVAVSGSPYTYYWTTDFGGFVDPTAHTATQPPSPAVTRYQQTDSRLGYTPVWSTSNGSSDSGGSVAYVNATGASVTVKFTGTYLAWVSRKGAGSGTAKVTLDSNAPVTVDLYNASTLFQQRVWTSGTLASGSHTVKIEWTGTKNASATSNAIGVDAIDVLGSLTQATAAPAAPAAPSPAVTAAPAPVRYEQTDSRFVYSGTWATFSTASASSGSYKRANTSGASVTVTFTGTYLAWIATAGRTLSRAYVSLDGGTAQVIDLARTAVAYQQRVWNTGTVGSGRHTVKIWWNTSNAAGKYISVDAFEVQGTLN